MKTELILNEYLTYAEQNFCSIERTRSTIKFLIAGLGKHDHSRLTPTVLRNYRAKENLAPASLNRELGVLRSALKYAVEQGRVRTFQRIAIRKGATPRKLWLRPEQIQSLLEAAKKYPVTLNFIRLALLTGQRKEALLSLRWTQVDSNVIWFADHDLSMGDRRKGRGSVPISAGLAVVLAELRSDSPYVLNASHGSRMRDINRDHWDAIVREAGVPDLTPHDLRHTVATNLIRDGQDLLAVSKLLGHANTAVTQRVYVTYEPQFLMGAVSKLDGLLGME